jgi:hypothetical protein
VASLENGQALMRILMNKMFVQDVAAGLGVEAAK